MRIPRKVYAHKKPYIIKFFDPDNFLDGNSLFGMTDFSSAVIQINRNQDRQGKEETLIHELLHVSLYLSDIKSGKHPISRFIFSSYSDIYIILRKNSIIKKFTSNFNYFDTGTFKYKVNYVTNLCDGEFLSSVSYDRRVLSINPNINSDIFGEELIRQFMRICFNEVGIDSNLEIDEEDFVSFVSPFLYRIFFINKFFRKS